MSVLLNERTAKGSGIPFACGPYPAPGGDAAEDGWAAADGRAAPGCAWLPEAEPVDPVTGVVHPEDPDVGPDDDVVGAGACDDDGAGEDPVLAGVCPWLGAEEPGEVGLGDVADRPGCGVGRRDSSSDWRRACSLAA